MKARHRPVMLSNAAMDDRNLTAGVYARGRVALTACQVRMARAALRWSVDELARRSGVSERTIRRIEKVYGIPNVTLDTMDKLQTSFEQQGMTMIPEDGSPEGPGVRFGRYPGRIVGSALASVAMDEVDDADGG
jgi:DNA-binding XRE family transcriptional regulator